MTHFQTDIFAIFQVSNLYNNNLIVMAIYT